MTNELSNFATQSSDSKSDAVIFTVEQLNINIRQILEGQLGIVWLQAEISNFKPHSSGHYYFSLKDARAQISAVMFRGSNSRLKFKPHDGLEVIVRGRITVYEPRGNYQIVCDSMEPVGAGALQKQFEQLKDKLKSEGLFSAERKKDIPPYPRHVAIVTSPTGAAIQDILNIMKRRAPQVEITVVPALVQGNGSAQSLREKFSLAEKIKPDVIIIGRGGGSIEDLWSFNDESLVRLIANSEIPVISAVGHEIDFTICDFVADLRAPTPSAAAELVSKSSQEVAQKVLSLDRQLKVSIFKFLQFQSQNLKLYVKQLIDPKKKLQDFIFRNDELYSRLENSMKSTIVRLNKDVAILEKRLVSPVQLLQGARAKIDGFQMRLENNINLSLENKKAVLKNHMSVLDSLSPLKVVDRGYSLVTFEKKIIKSVKSLNLKDEFEIQMTDGFISAQVVSKNEKVGKNGI